MNRLTQTLIVLAGLAWMATPTQAQTNITCDVSDPSTDVIVARQGGGRGPAQNTFNVMFCGSSYDAASDETTFKYRLRQVEIKNDLSHWSLQFCPRAMSSYVSGSASPRAENPGKDGSTGLTNVLKWETGSPFKSQDFTFRLRGRFGTTDVVVNAKAGPHNSGTAFTIPGPSCAVDFCDELEPPTYDGGYVLNDAKTRAFIKVDVPEGATEFEFYNTRNLVVEDPETNPESNTKLTYASRVGNTFTFAEGSKPTVAFFPIRHADPKVSGVAFFLRVSDACGQTVDVDPHFALTGAAESITSDLALSAQPNPTAGPALVRFSLGEAGPARLAVYDMLGREVAVLLDGEVAAGDQSVSFDGAALPAGVYVYRLTTATQTLTRTLLIAR